MSKSEICNLVTAFTPCELNGQISNRLTGSTHGIDAEAFDLMTATTPCGLNRQISNTKLPQIMDLMEKPLIW